MLGAIIFFYIALLVLAIYLQYILARFFANVAEEKGYYDKRYFWTPFWLGIVGYLLVIALPDKYARAKAMYTQYAKGTPTASPASATHTPKTSITGQTPASSTQEAANEVPEVAKLPCPHCGEDIGFMDFSEEDIKNGTAVCPFCNALIKSN